MIGVGLGIAIAVGAFVVYEGTLIRLSNPAELVPWVGTVIQMGGIVVAVVAGVIAVFGPRRTIAEQTSQR